MLMIDIRIHADDLISISQSGHQKSRGLGLSTQLLMLRVTMFLRIWISMNKYRWNPSIEVDVRHVFNKIGSKSFSDCLSKARKKAEKPEFMNQVTWEALCGVWRLPAFVAKSERGKTARQSNKRLHTGGSIPISEHKKKLREELSREPSVSELFLRCHQNKKTKVFVDATAKAAWEGYNAVHGADDALDAHSGNGAKTFPKWIDCVGSKNGTAYGVGDVDEYVCQPNIEEPYAHNIPNVEIVQLVDLIKVQQVDHNLLKTECSCAFFNGADVNSKKPSWVRWKSVLAAKDVRGLRVSSLFTLNRALIFKWVWRFFSQKNSLWVRVVKALHGEDGKIGKKV
nr:RNA-directed DNA polymerase, eukaryota, reverse transcriptase zinc-binding domain protein [Tanacetum cinerariifolium]